MATREVARLSKAIREVAQPLTAEVDLPAEPGKPPGGLRDRVRIAVQAKDFRARGE